MPARTTLLLALGATVSAVAAHAHAQQELELTLNVSEQRVLSADGVSSYSEGLPGIADVRLTQDGSQFVIVGQRPGVTSLLLVMADGGQRQGHPGRVPAHVLPEPELVGLVQRVGETGSAQESVLGRVDGQLRRSDHHGQQACGDDHAAAGEHTQANASAASSGVKRCFMMMLRTGGCPAGRVSVAARCGVVKVPPP